MEQLFVIRSFLKTSYGLCLPFITETESAGLGNNEYYRVFIDERYLIGEDKYSSMQRLFSVIEKAKKSKEERKSRIVELMG